MKKVLIGLVSVFAPVLAFAQTAPNLTYVDSGAQQIFNLLRFVMPVLMIAATGYFIWEVVKYIKSSPEDKKKNRQQLTGGIVALAVIVSMWGIVGLLQNVFGIRAGQSTTNIVCPPGFTAINGRCV